MTNTTETPPSPRIETGKPRRFSPVWLIPLLAVAVALGLLWNEYRSQGPIIEIVMPTASGLTAGETKIRYKDVTVGVVEDIRFSKDLSSVIVSARISPEVSEFVDAEAEFWVVRPEVSAQGISGLETVLSGVYIAGQWDAAKGAPKKRFEALKEIPLTPADTPGRRVVLRSSDGGSLSAGAPIFFRRVEVGRVETKRLTADGGAVEFDIFVNAPHDKRLTKETRFWNVSGIDFSFGADGARMNIGSLASIIQGGAAFEDLSGGDAPEVEGKHVFLLYPTERQARERSLEIDPSERLQLDAYFSGSVRGLTPGAPVEYQGIRVGRVAAVSAEIDTEAGVFATRTTMALSPSRLGLEEDNVPGALAFMEQATRNGLRAQLTTGNLFTGSLIVRLILAPEQGPGEISKPEGMNPRMPTIPTDLDELAGSIEGVLRRVDALPIEALIDNAVTLLENTNTLLASEGMRAAPGNAADALKAAETLLSDPAMVAIPGKLDALLTSLSATADSDALKTALTDLATVTADAAAITTALREGDVAGQVAGAVGALRARLEDPALATLIASLGETAAATTALLSDPALKAAPAEVNAALVSLRTILDDPATRATPEQLNASIAAARSILEDFQSAGTATEIANAAKAARQLLDDPSLRRLSTETADAAAAIRALLTAPGAEDLPASAAKAMASAAALMDEIAEQDLAKASADALKEIEGATAAIRQAANQAPALMKSLSSTAKRADDLLASLQVGSELNYETVTAIREIRDAARAITDLAALVERNPSAFILGK